MKVAVYSHSIPPSVDGVARRMTSLLYELAKDGHEVGTFAFKNESSGGWRFCPLGSSGVKIQCSVEKLSFLRHTVFCLLVTPLRKFLVRFSVQQFFYRVGRRG